MDGGFGRKLVDEPDFQLLAAPDAQHGPRNRAVVAALAGADDPESVRLPECGGYADERGSEAGGQDLTTGGKRWHRAYVAHRASPPHPIFLMRGRNSMI